MNSSSSEAELESSNYNIHPFITTSFIHQQQRQHNASLLATDHAFVGLNIDHLAFMLIRPVCQVIAFLIFHKLGYRFLGRNHSSQEHGSLPSHFALSVEQ